MSKRAKKPVSVTRPWRLSASGQEERFRASSEDAAGPAHGSEFDELVVADWLHIEQMGDRSWWMRIGDGGSGNPGAGVTLWIEIDPRGPVTVRLDSGSPVRPGGGDPKAGR